MTYAGIHTEPRLVEVDFAIEPHPGMQQLSLRSLAAHGVGSLIASFAGSHVMPRANRYTVQRDQHEHLDLRPEFLRYINHSCNPNVYFDMDRSAVVVIAPIARGDELTFFYPSTEWDMCEPFECLCKANSCVGWIRGAKHLGPALLARYRVSPYIRRRSVALFEAQSL